MRRISAHRDDAEAPIVDALRRLGASVLLILAFEKGAPDAVIGYRDMTVLAQIKTGKRKLKPEQNTFAEQWRGGWVMELRTVDEAVQLLKAMAHASRC